MDFKIYNLGENDKYSIENIIKTFKGPFYISIHDDGFLGMLTIENNKLIFKIGDENFNTLKLNIDKYHKLMNNFDKLESFGKLYDKLNKKTKAKLTKTLEENNSFALFNIISKNHKNIFDYEEDKLILLDIIKNDTNIIDVNYSNNIINNNLTSIVDNHFEISGVNQINDDDLPSIINKIINMSKQIKSKSIILTDSTGKQFKVDSTYYNNWKQINRLLERLKKLDYIDKLEYLDLVKVDDVKILEFLKLNVDNINNLDIITLRNDFENYKNNQSDKKAGN